MEKGHEAFRCMERFVAFPPHYLRDAFKAYVSVGEIHVMCSYRGTHRSSLCGCEHERVGHDGLHVQQGAAECCQLPHKGPVSGLEDGSGVV